MYHLSERSFISDHLHKRKKEIENGLSASAGQCHPGLFLDKVKIRLCHVARLVGHTCLGMLSPPANTLLMVSAATNRATNGRFKSS